MPEQIRNIPQLRTAYFDVMRASVRTRTIMLEEAGVAPGQEPSSKLKGDLAIESMRRDKRIGTIASEINEGLRADREDIRADLLTLLGRHARQVSQAEGLAASGTQAERAEAQRMLELLNWRQKHDPFLVAAQNLVSERTQSGDVSTPEGEGILTGTILPDSAPRILRDEQEEEERRKHCQYEVFSEQLTALEAYVAVRKENTAENRKAFGRALAQLQHKDAAGDVVPLTHIGQALKSLTDNAVRMLEERTYTGNAWRYKRKPGETEEQAKKRGAWAPLTEREKAVWSNIVEVADPDGKERQRGVVPRALEAKFGREFREWYREDANKPDVRAGYYEGKLAVTRKPTRRTASTGVAPVKDLLPGLQAGDTGAQERQEKPVLTEREAAALAAMIIQIDGIDVYFPGLEGPQMHVALSADLMQQCRALVRDFTQARSRMSDDEVIANRTSAIGKLGAILSDEANIDAQKMDFDTTNADMVSPTDRLQYNILVPLLYLNEEMAGHLPTFLMGTQVEARKGVTVQVSGKDPFVNAISVPDDNRWNAPEAMADAIMQYRLTLGRDSTAVAR